MQVNFQLLLLWYFIAVPAHAQNDQYDSLNIGDVAPPLRVREWIKGAPVKRFENGMVYVVEFWATWCGPCKAAMPRLSVLAGEFRDNVTILGIDIYENEKTSLKKIKAFVDSMGRRMDYHVAVGDSNLMAAAWLNASGEGDTGIPKTFVVNGEGRLAWIGHPKNLETVLPKIVNKTWNLKESLAKRNFNKHLEYLDKEAYYELIRYGDDLLKPDDLGKPDSALLMINEMVKNEPNLKYAPIIAFHTFSSLLKTNLYKAYEYGKVVLSTSTYQDPAYYAIIDPIKLYSNKLNLPAEIYLLGAEAYQGRIDQVAYPENVDISKLYNKMAEWYGRANDKSKAIDAQQKAIEALKSKKDFSATEMAAFESRLQQYKKM